MKNFTAVGSMRDNRKTFVHYSAENGPCCKVSIRYDEGGYSMWDYKNKPRGIRISVQEIIRSTSAGGMACEQYAPLNDANFFFMLEETKRYNLKALTAQAEALDDFAGKFAALYMSDRAAAVALFNEQFDLPIAA